MHVASVGFHNTGWNRETAPLNYLSFAQHCGTIFFPTKTNLKAIVIFSLFYYFLFIYLFFLPRPLFYPLRRRKRIKDTLMSQIPR